MMYLLPFIQCCVVFRSATTSDCPILQVLRSPSERLACAVCDCMDGWGTYETGLITLLVHLSERQRRELVAKYWQLRDGGDIYKTLTNVTSGATQRALLALVKPPPRVWAEALLSSMKGLGTSDNLLINWMHIAKERMDEVRTHFQELDGRGLAAWIANECSDSDYKEVPQTGKHSCWQSSGAAKIVQRRESAS